MGASSSVIAEQTRKTFMSIPTNKPLDASDITDLTQAKTEIIFMRKVMAELTLAMKEGVAGPGAGGHKKREAVRDQAKQIKQDDDAPPKIIPKSDDIRTLITNVVRSNILFSSYAQDEQSAIVDAFEPYQVDPDTFVIKQGEMGDNFYVVESGSLDIFIKNSEGHPTKVGMSLNKGNSFGELALMYNTPRAASIKSTEACVLWRIDRSCYRGIVVRFKHMRNKQYIGFLRNVEVKGQKLGVIMSDAELEKMTVSLERESFEEGESIVVQGNKGDHFFIIAVGDVGVYQAKGEEREKLTTLHVGDYFGEKALLSEDVRQASCIAESQVTCLTLGRHDFIDMIGAVDDLIQKMRESPTPGISPEKPAAAQEQPKGGQYDIAMRLEDLEIKSTLGCGAFGRVKLAKSGDRYFALKCQAKKAIQEQGLEEHVLNEMRIMCRLDHPLIAKLYSSMQDSRYIYFLLELLQGGELFTHLRNSVKISEPCAKFYAASVLSAFQSLHEKRIAYRDLKPENLVFDEKGYVKLVDFGLAKVLTEGKTWTLCGTPDYLAPEIILNEGHDLAVDYWALGILIFEMVVGSPPFFAEDPMEVYEKILGANPAMPTFFSKNLSDLVKKLLRGQQAKRLGNIRGGISAIIKHKWFSSFEWGALESGDMAPPHKPTIAGREDVSNFDAFEDAPNPDESDWTPEL